MRAEPGVDQLTEIHGDAGLLHGDVEAIHDLNLEIDGSADGNRVVKGLRNERRVPEVGRVATTNAN